MQPANIRIHTPAASYLDETFSYALTGCNRVDHLIGVYQEVRKSSGKQRGRVWTHLSDILRAAVVLCHANLEQVLRSLIAIEAEWRPEFLQRIPLPDSKHSRADRFSLADLVIFGDRPVSDVVSNAVWEHLSNRSFTQVSDVTEVLTMCNLDVARYRKFFPGIKGLMERRHHIAHTADLEEDSPGRGKQIARSISASTVLKWNRNIWNFISELLSITLSLRPNTSVKDKRPLGTTNNKSKQPKSRRKTTES